MKKDSPTLLRIISICTREALEGISNNRITHAICILTISMSFLMIGLFLLGFINVDNWIRKWGSEDINISVYLDDDIKKEEKVILENRINNIKGVKEKKFITKEQALGELKNMLKEQSGLIDSLKENPLPASYELVLDRERIHSIQEIKKMLEGLPGVNEVQYTTQYREKLEGFLYIIKLCGIVILIFLCIASLIIIYNTIKLNIYTRDEEIEISRLVGATEWFVKTPFIIEGLIQGLLGGVISILILYILFLIFSFKKLYILGFPLPEPIFLSFPWIVFLILFSIFIGISGGILAVSGFDEK